MAHDPDVMMENVCQLCTWAPSSGGRIHATAEAQKGMWG